ncbi:MAG: hypothetical protein DRO11_02420 [Methanobacteriota archaeon]|nr:MAG: hypothetical protein DRO11_02420 [Euryarchaeota archaeon]
MATDACEEHGIHLLDDYKLLNRIFGGLIPYFGSTRNPVDVTGQSDEEKYAKVLRAALASDKIHTILLIYCQAAQSRPRDMARYIIEETKRNPLKPVITVFIGGEESKKAIETLLSSGIPSFPDVGRAVRSLAAYYRWVGYKKELSQKKKLEEFDMNLEKIKNVIRSARIEGRTQLLETESNDICEAAGIKTAVTRFCETVDECLDQAEELGYPVVLKVVSEDIIHKSDVGGVKVDLGSPEELITAYTEIMSNIGRKKPGARIRGMLVSKMVRDGLETIAGISRDPQFGPIVMFGLGGVYVEALKDVSFRVAPLTKLDAHKMVHQIRASRLLYGFRGEKRRDISAIIDVLLRLGQLSTKVEDIVEMDLNPLLVLPKGGGCIAVDTRITITKEAKP